MIDISIIIVNYKGWKDLKKCLDSLIAIKKERFTLEINVVDNNSNDGKLKGFKKDYPSILFIENEGNNGFANGCNVGAKKAKGDYLLFLNPDTIATEEAIFELLNFAKNDDSCGIVTCSQFNENGKKYKEVRYFPSIKTLFGSFRVVNKILNYKKIATDFENHKKIIYPEWVTGAVIFISKNWFEKLNGWNEKYWLYFEDIDICFRIKKLGGKVVLLRGVNILHKHGGATRINVKTKSLTKTEVLISKHVYIHEHYSGIKRFVIQFLLVSNNLIIKSLVAFFSFFLFFMPKMKVNLLIYKKLINYYFSALINKNWLSPRSITYKCS